MSLWKDRYEDNFMIKYESGFEKSDLVSSDLCLTGKLFGQVWLCLFLVTEVGYWVNP